MINDRIAEFQEDSIFEPDIRERFDLVALDNRHLRDIIESLNNMYEYLWKKRDIKSWRDSITPKLNNYYWEEDD
jgi:hypothetical protein